MHRRTVFTVLVLVPLIGLTIAARTTPKPSSTAQPTNKTTPAVSTKPPSKTNSTKVSKTDNSNVRLGTRIGGTKKVITTRLGSNGNAEEQCECTVFYLCDQNDVITLPEGSTNTCSGNDVCCAIPITLVTNDPLSGIPSLPPVTETPFVSSENPIQVSVSTQSINLGQPCVCVPFYQCPDYDPLTATAGAGLLDVRIPLCTAPEVCCPPNNIVTTTSGVRGPETEVTPIVTQTSAPPPATPSPEECGFRRGQAAIDTRIVSPEAAMQTTFGEFPWMALILTSEVSSNNEVIENVFVCGASLLSPFIILTAAHCVNEANISLLKVRVGEYDTHRGSEEPRPHQDRLVRTIHVHPNFHSKVLFNDLALLSVEEPFELAAHVSPICVPLMNSPYAAPNSYNPSNCIATGWGKNAFAEGSFQTTLRKVDLSIIPREQCQTQLRNTRLGQFFNLDPSFICAGGRPGFDTCQGDGGGPLFCALNENPNRYVQVGIVSWGIGCANGVPGVYASLEANRDWLSTEFNTMTVFRRPT